MHDHLIEHQNDRMMSNSSAAVSSLPIEVTNWLRPGAGLSYRNDVGAPTITTIIMNIFSPLQCGERRIGLYTPKSNTIRVVYTRCLSYMETHAHRQVSCIRIRRPLCWSASHHNANTDTSLSRKIVPFSHARRQTRNISNLIRIAPQLSFIVEGLRHETSIPKALLHQVPKPAEPRRAAESSP